MHERIPLPNFFILGAGRSGTTALANVLRSHPDVFIPTMKEPSFFASSFQWVSDPGKYVGVYEPGRGHRRVGDASHVYLEDPGSPRILQSFTPDARHIVVFRDPIDRALALYSYMIERGYEVNRTFEKALDAEDRRFDDARFRKRCAQSFWNYMYVRSGMYGQQVERYLDHFEPDRFHFTTLPRLIANTETEVAAICEFLGVAPLPIDEFPRDGSSKGVRSIPLQYVERRLVRPIGRRTGGPGARLNRTVNDWNRGSGKPTMLDETRLRLRARFEPDLRRLRELTGVDLLWTD